MTPPQPDEPRPSPEQLKRSKNEEIFAPKEEGVVVSSCRFLRCHAALDRFVQRSELTRTNQEMSLQTSVCGNTLNEGFLDITV